MVNGHGWSGTVKDGNVESWKGQLNWEVVWPKVIEGSLNVTWLKSTLKWNWAAPPSVRPLNGQRPRRSWSRVAGCENIKGHQLGENSDEYIFIKLSSKRYWSLNMSSSLCYGWQNLPGGSVHLDIKALTQYTGEGRCEQVELWGDTGNRYMTEVERWAEMSNRGINPLQENISCHFGNKLEKREGTGSWRSINTFMGVTLIRKNSTHHYWSRVDFESS